MTGVRLGMTLPANRDIVSPYRLSWSILLYIPNENSIVKQHENEMKTGFHEWQETKETRHKAWSPRECYII